MRALSHRCIAHRRAVIVAWVLLAIVLTVIASAVGRNYANDFSLPNTQSQHVTDLLKSEFSSENGDIDQVVFHTTRGTVQSATVRNAITPLLKQIQTMPHVASVDSPYSAQGGFEISKDQRTAFATVTYTKRANLLPNDTGKPLLNAIRKIKVPGLTVAAGGQVIESAEGFGVGPATAVGVVAAFVILLLTFGSLLAAGMPLITAGLGLIAGLALVGLATHVTSMSNISPELALMIGLGVGIDYALFIVTRFRQNYEHNPDIVESVIEAMDTSGRAILLAGTTVIIALLGMFATGVTFMYGLSIASILAVLLVLSASLTVLPALLVFFGPRLVKPGRSARRRGSRGAAPRPSQWRRWSQTVQRRPKSLALISLLVMLVFVAPILTMRLESSDAGNDPAGKSTRVAFDLLAAGFGPGFNGPLLIAAELQGPNAKAGLTQLRSTLASTPDVVTVTPPRVSPSGKVAVLEVYPKSSPQATATTKLVNRLRNDVLPPLRSKLGITALVGGFTAGSIDFSHVLARKLPLFIAIVVVLSALLLLVIFRSLVIPLQAAAMNLLSIGGALGATVAVFQKGWLFGVQPAPIEPWIPVIMFAVVFGLSMDYEVFLISRVREEWVRHRDPSLATADGIAFTGRVISAAALIMICVFLSFILGDERTLREFGFGLAAAVFLDALIVRCVMLPAVLELLGPWTWKLPGWLDRALPHINIEGRTAAAEAGAERGPREIAG
jgi:putative drug exporter of the RND superfamily